MTDLQLLKVLNAVNRGLAFLSPLVSAGVWNWNTARGQSRKNTFFGVRVEPGFGESEPGLAIQREFQWRLWSWALAAAIASTLIPVRFALFLLLVTMTAAYVAFGGAHRRVKREVAAPIGPTVRVATLTADDDVESPWLNVIDGLAMGVPPLMPAATLMFLNLHREQMGAYLGRGLFIITFNLIAGLYCTANEWALRFRARSRDWAPTPDASHKYRTYSGAMMSIVFTGIGLQSCLYALIALKDTGG